MRKTWSKLETLMSATTLLVGFTLLCVLFLTSCGAGSSVDITSYLGPEDGVYRLDSGDVIKVTVFDEKELSGEFQVDGSGAINMPLVGTQEVSNLTPAEAEEVIIKSLSNGYLQNPKVALEVVNYRPFYIMGEVRVPGSYSYVDGMTVANAVALSGGYTYRAKRSDIIVKRSTVNEKGEDVITTYGASPDTLVLPGDIVEIQERIF